MAEKFSPGDEHLLTCLAWHILVTYLLARRDCLYTCECYWQRLQFWESLWILLAETPILGVSVNIIGGNSNFGRFCECYWQRFHFWMSLPITFTETPKSGISANNIHMCRDCLFSPIYMLLKRFKLSRWASVCHQVKTFQPLDGRSGHVGFTSVSSDINCFKGF